MQRRMTEEEIIWAFDDAIEQGQIYMVYQPQYNHSTGRMIGAEALMRWKHPEFGEQYPSDFIPVMEKYGLVHRQPCLKPSFPSFQVILFLFGPQPGSA